MLAGLSPTEVTTLMHANLDTHTQTDATKIISVLLRLAPSLNDRGKLKGQCTDVKSGCGPSVGPSLSPHSLS